MRVDDPLSSVCCHGHNDFSDIPSEHPGAATACRPARLLDSAGRCGDVLYQVQWAILAKLQCSPKEALQQSPWFPASSSQGDPSLPDIPESCCQLANQLLNAMPTSASQLSGPAATDGFSGELLAENQGGDGYRGMVAGLLQDWIIAETERLGEPDGGHPHIVEQCSPISLADMLSPLPSAHISDDCIHGRRPWSPLRSRHARTQCVSMP